MKKIIALLITLIALKVSFSGLCDYIPGYQPITRCEGNELSLTATPGSEGNFSITCCVASEELCKSNETVKLNVELVYNTWNKTHPMPYNKTFYGSYFITNISYDKEVEACKPFTIVLHYKMPKESKYYKPGAKLDSEIEIIPYPKKFSAMIPVATVIISFFIPLNWKPKTNYIFYIGIALVIVGFILGVFLLLRSKRRKSLKNSKVNIHEKSNKNDTHTLEGEKK